MNFSAKVPVVILGSHYNSTKLAFPNAQLALELMAILAQCVEVEEDIYTHSKLSGQKVFLCDEQGSPELKFYPANQFNGRQTSNEAKASWEAAQKASEDLEAQVKVRAEPAVLCAPKPDDDIPF